MLAGVALIALLSTGTVHLLRKVYWRTEMDVTRTADVTGNPTRINVNAAGRHELQLLPNIGPKTADAILQYRRQNGPFGSLKDLKQVSGIGPATVDEIRPHAMCAPVKSEVKEE